MKKNIDKKHLEYVDTEDDYKKRIRTEIIFTPLLVILPFVVGVFLINDWYIRDIIRDEMDLFGELLLGLLIIVVNIIFDVPFLRNLLKQIKKR